MATTNAQTQIHTKVVSIFKPHHATQVLYPSSRLLKEDESSTIKIPNVHDRYEPHPIVQYAAVTLNKNGGNQTMDTDFTSYNPTSLWPDDEIVSTGNLFADMQAVTQHIGCTKLRVVLFHDRAAAVPGVRPESHIRINKFSRLEMSGGKVHYDQHEYSMPLRQFDAAVAHIRVIRGSPPCWAKELVELIRMTSDHAVLHVGQRLSAIGLGLPDFDWKPARTISLEKAIGHLLRS